MTNKPRHKLTRVQHVKRGDVVWSPPHNAYIHVTEVQLYDPSHVVKLCYVTWWGGVGRLGAVINDYVLVRL
ncbi:hypothetical protein Vid5_gp73 [Pantoea phage vB_PagS_Vid5]|uniref:Uncharacterized protein n=1 Tax=Pantoea phage vB_PagS_Vid5 TaxID=2099652 RepID=A0A2P1CKW8_9CAUD|nr:hypothetical protein FDJ45_gp082 [Pantoea phage vB_PagS_Vid5]AVJ51828.1 hypothetical protein Vid5_gp73 [Pantoea phage vB_PagS_Vid5]